MNDHERLEYHFFYCIKEEVKTLHEHKPYKQI